MSTTTPEQNRHASGARDTVERTRRSDREYDDEMRKPSLTFDAILAAIAVLSTGTACSKADRASAEPPAAAPAATAPAATASATPAAEPPPPPVATAASPAIDAGTERAPAPNAKPKGGSAACGATGCSADMRKGGK
jgi:hypothetical protein